MERNDVLLPQRSAPTMNDLPSLSVSVMERARLFEAALQNMSQGLCMFDAQSRLLVSNRRYHEIYGIPADAMRRGMTQLDICKMLVELGCYPASVTAAGIAQNTHIALEAGNGFPILRELADGRVISVVYRVIEGGGWVSTFEDVTERRQSEARITHLAQHDALTDLVNTSALRRRYIDLVEMVDPERPLLALCYIDLDRFNLVNDTYGHAVGDELLQALAKRLRANTREDEVVARLGGDEFVVVLRVADDAAAKAAALRLVDMLSNPYRTLSGRIDVSVSVGIATRSACDLKTRGDIDPFLHDANLAVRHAKSEGGGGTCFFDLTMATSAHARNLIEAELKIAVAERQFVMHYQALVSVRDRTIIGAEALVRWQHPTRGLVSPISFISIMEETGLIVPLGLWVLDQACQDAMRWPDHICVAVNVSSIQMRQRAFGQSVLGVLAKTGLPPHRLEIEITESSLLDECEVTQNNLFTLHDVGVRFAMDDFGTGYSSLSYLRRFPISKIKIDRSFMQDAENRADSRAIIRAVASIGSSLGITTLVEGVETEQQLDLARAEGVDQVQGYLLSRPQPEAVFAELIAGSATANFVSKLSSEQS